MKTEPVVLEPYMSDTFAGSVQEMKSFVLLPAAVVDLVLGSFAHVALLLGTVAH